jgi:hypothetical protein
MRARYAPLRSIERLPRDNRGVIDAFLRSPADG